MTRVWGSDWNQLEGDAEPSRPADGQQAPEPCRGIALIGLLRMAVAAHRDGDSDNQHHQTDDDRYGFHFGSVCVVFALVK